jgi:hypothetical protein
MATGSLARLIADPKGKAKTLNDIETLAANQERLQHLATDLDPQLVKEEWEHVIRRHQGLTSLTAYRIARRPRRPRLFRPLREAIWTAVEDIEAHLTGSGQTTFPLPTVEATAVLAARVVRPYRHVIVDEAQDMTPIRCRLLRASVSPGPDDLFLVGDAHLSGEHGTEPLRHQHPRPLS